MKTENVNIFYVIKSRCRDPNYISESLFPKES